jgi:beta-galactosidase
MFPTMNIGAQYYRAPFPDSKYWEDDMRRMRDSGLNTVQLWLLWSWIEAKPGEYAFDDYDRLVELADKHGLGLVLSTIAEIQPYWIHREVPGSEMVNHLGHQIVSQNRTECHFGLTPGGCTDHPGVWERMSAFLSAVAIRYRDLPNLRGWDCWNETRWNVDADGIVCHCPHTLAAFRHWLNQTYGGLEGLNRVWKRRYRQWDEVQPGKWPGHTYTEMMAFSHFLTVRSNQHGRNRYDVIKALDSKHPVTLHGAHPCSEYAGHDKNTPMDRGNDWAFADHLDGIGCSSFPIWGGGIDDADFGMRIDLVRSAAQGKHIWLSELQGGRGNIGFDLGKPVDALSQQRWIWNGIACGADTILFWCWRDEVFGRESNGYGLSGGDGLADERLAAMRVTGDVLKKHKELIDDYRATDATVGVLLSPQSYYLQYADTGTGYAAAASFHGYCRALVRKSIPFIAVEEEHLDALDGLSVLFMPRILVFSPALETALKRFIENGGTLVCESECGAFNPQGFYSYPTDRFLARLTGVKEIGRVQLTGNTVAADLDGLKCELELTQWLTPLEYHQGTVHAGNKDGALLSSLTVGAGRVIYFAGYLGESYRAKPNPGFEEYVAWVVRKTGVQSEIEVLSPQPDPVSFLYVKHGMSGNRRIVFVFFQKDHHAAHLRFRKGFFASESVRDLITDAVHRLAPGPLDTTELKINCPDWGFVVLAEEEKI